MVSLGRGPSPSPWRLASLSGKLPCLLEAIAVLLWVASCGEVSANRLGTALGYLPVGSCGSRSSLVCGPTEAQLLTLGWRCYRWSWCFVITGTSVVGGSEVMPVLWMTFHMRDVIHFWRFGFGRTSDCSNEGQFARTGCFGREEISFAGHHFRERRSRPCFFRQRQRREKQRREGHLTCARSKNEKRKRRDGTKLPFTQFCMMRTIRQTSNGLRPMHLALRART